MTSAHRPDLHGHGRAAIGVGALTVGQVLPWLLARWPWLDLTWWIGALALALAIALLDLYNAGLWPIGPAALLPSNIQSTWRACSRQLSWP